MIQTTLAEWIAKQTAPRGQEWVCTHCGKRSTIRMCVYAVLCHEWSFDRVQFDRGPCP